MLPVPVERVILSRLTISHTFETDTWLITCCCPISRTWAPHGITERWNTHVSHYGVLEKQVLEDPFEYLLQPVHKTSRLSKKGISLRLPLLLHLILSVSNPDRGGTQIALEQGYANSPTQKLWPITELSGSTICVDVTSLKLDEGWIIDENRTDEKY
ncbi:hypothetical protein J6590_059817 [Homalodisca vitripennis]|nr:hypothetical protein J6590_059817 [Homalodisca vitripennis]